MEGREEGRKERWEGDEGLYHEHIHPRLNLDIWKEEGKELQCACVYCM